MRLLQMLAVFCMAAFVFSGAARAQSQLVLAISEGTSGGLDHGRVISKYQDLANLIGGALKTKVSVVFAREFATLESGMKEGKFDFVMARPSDYPARGMRDYGYHYLANAKPDGQCLIVVPNNSPLKTLADARGKRFVMPEQVSYMSRFCRAELRDRGIDLAKENVQYVREQAAVTFYMDNKFADVGAIASYSGPAKKLDKDGFRILHSSVVQPYFPLVAHGKFKPEQLKAIQMSLASVPEKPGGPEILQRIGIAAFDTGAEERMKSLLDWLEK
ncbi:MAG: PhnD/SsuA/transferrin family substrate-binding protein [Hylemonella sp.]